MRVIIDRDVRAVMRDGVELSANVFRPADDGRFPVLLQRTPYGKDLYPTTFLPLDPIRIAAEGYVVIEQDCRGRGASAGSFAPFEQEFEDGMDSLEWAAGLPYSNGRVGTFGVSYTGTTAWQAAVEGHSSLTSVAAAQAPADHHSLLWRGGAFQLGFFVFWTSFHLGLPELVRTARPGPERTQGVLESVALIDDFEATVTRVEAEGAEAVGNARALPYGSEAPRHPYRDDFNRARSVDERLTELRVPALVTAGWHDIMLEQDLRSFATVRRDAATPAAREESRLVVGPWSHGLGMQASVVGQLDFGVRASGLSLDLEGDLTSHHLAWFDRWNGGRTAGEAAPVNVFVMGADRWRALEDWPPPGLREEAVHLTATGGLEARPPQAAAEPRRYSYDPEDPCPTCGGAIMLPLTYPRGPVDQRRITGRPDVLLYRSAPLQETLELIGPVSARIWARTTAAETDWVLKLCRVTSSGAILNLCDGVLRAAGLVPGEIHAHEVELAATAASLAPGERLALTITSSDFPRYSRAREVAIQEIFGDVEHPSNVVLPVVAGKLTV